MAENANEAEIELHFSALPKPALSATVFQHPKLIQSQCAYRGKDEGARLEGSGFFQWSPAVQVLAVLLLRWAVWAKRSRNNGSALKPVLTGGRHSAALTLSNAISKKTGSFCAILGTIGSGKNKTPLVSDIIRRTNPDFKLPGPVILLLDLKNHLHPEKIKVFQDNAPMEDPDELENVAKEIETHCDGLTFEWGEHSRIGQFLEALGRREQHSWPAPETEVPWSPKVVRLGLSCGLIQENSGQVGFSSRFIQLLCEECRVAVTGNSVLVPWTRHSAIAAAKAIDRTVEMDQADLVDLVCEMSRVPLISYLVGVGCAARLMSMDGAGTISLNQHMADEFCDMAITSSERLNYVGDVRPWAMRACVDLVRARLLLYHCEKRDHCHLLALFVSIFLTERIESLEQVVAGWDKEAGSIG